METFIYLLITIVILVLSMRKKRPVQPVTGEEVEAGDPFRDLFKDEDEDYDPEPQSATVADDDNVYAGIGSNPWMSEADARKMLIDADAVMKEAAENNPIAEFEGQVEEDAYSLGVAEDGGIPFDLKKAVIYSEIIERRAF